MDVQTTLREFVQETFVKRRQSSELSGDQSLLDSGIIDSAGVLELVSFIERTFGVTVADTDIVPENFETLNSLSAFVNAKQTHESR